MIQINFTKTDGRHTFSDALWLEDDHTLSLDDIEVMQQARFDVWLAIINTIPTEE